MQVTKQIALTLSEREALALLALLRAADPIALHDRAPSLDWQTIGEITRAVHDALAYPEDRK